MLTIVFYSTEGAAAKVRGRQIVAQGKGNYARVYDVGTWDGTYDKCDAVEIMPDVQGWQRDRITEVYGEVEEAIAPDQAEIERLEQLARKPLGLMPAKETVPVEKKAVHRGGGRWFVMAGDNKIISGPHEKAEAARLAALEDEPNDS